MSGNLGNIHLRYQDVNTGKVVEQQKTLNIGQTITPGLQFLSAVAEYAEILRGSYWAKESSLQNVLEMAKSSALEEQQLEFVRLVKDSIAIKGK